MFEGVPNYPDNSRWWQIVDKHKVNIFYTVNSDKSADEKEGDDFVKKTSRKIFKIIGYCW